MMLNISFSQYPKTEQRLLISDRLKKPEDIQKTVFEYLQECQLIGIVFVDLGLIPPQHIAFPEFIEAVSAGIRQAKKEYGISANISMVLQSESTTEQAENLLNAIESYPHPDITAIRLSGAPEFLQRAKRLKLNIVSYFNKDTPFGLIVEGLQRFGLNAIELDSNAVNDSKLMSWIEILKNPIGYFKRSAEKRTLYVLEKLEAVGFLEPLDHISLKDKIEKAKPISDPEKAKEHQWVSSYLFQPLRVTYTSRSESSQNFNLAQMHKAYNITVRSLFCTFLQKEQLLIQGNLYYGYMQLKQRLQNFDNATLNNLSIAYELHPSRENLLALQNQISILNKDLDGGLNTLAESMLTVISQHDAFQLAVQKQQTYHEAQLKGFQRKMNPKEAEEDYDEYESEIEADDEVVVEEKSQIKYKA